MLSGAETDSAEAALDAAFSGAEGRRGRVLVSATSPIEPRVDPSAVAFSSRRANDRWFCWEQPDLDGLAIAGIGSAHELSSRGRDRFSDVAAGWGRLLTDRVAEEPPGLPAGAGPLLAGGFAFAPDGGSTPEWSSFEPALMILPELSIWRGGSEAYLTLAAVLEPGEDADAARARLRARLASIRADAAALPLLDPTPTGRSRIHAPRPPGEYESAVAAAVDRIAGGAVEKVVLAREVTVDSPAAHDPAAIIGALRELFPSCFCFCVGTPEAAFLGASPELLIRRRGPVAAAVALAGSTRRSADPAVDDLLGEQMLHSAKVRQEHQIVARRIARSLRPHSVWVDADDEPSVVRVANIQHLATPIQAQLADSRSAISLAGLLHPTPAVGGEPRDRAVAMIAELEGLDRGWYAGPVGWMDAADDGEFCVALRSALLRDRTAHLYAGCGIVAGSDPASELAETEIKLDALLPLLSA
jgi:salicylate biosynthesis isochorismate synthase